MPEAFVCGKCAFFGLRAVLEGLLSDISMPSGMMLLLFKDLQACVVDLEGRVKRYAVEGTEARFQVVALGGCHCISHVHNIPLSTMPFTQPFVNGVSSEWEVSTPHFQYRFTA